MLDRRTIHNVDARTINPSKVEVHEHKAPTDESVRILREMEAAALKNVVRSFSFGNTLSAAMVESYSDASAGRTVLCYSFELNDERFEGQVPLNQARHFLETGDHYGFGDYVLEQVAKAIAAQLFKLCRASFREVARR